jgi:hypothetical protein
MSVSISASACGPREPRVFERRVSASGGGAPRTLKQVLLNVVMICGIATSVVAQDTHVLVITGVSGDAEHAEKFHKWASAIVDAASKRGGVAAANITYLAEKPELDAARIRGRSTRENVQKAFADIGATARPNDELFVLLIGHGSFDGTQAAFNLPGPDLTAADYATLLSKLPALRVVFVNTASSSGGFLEALKGPGRAVVTATKTGGERNETRFAEYFAEGFAENAADGDRNGRVSVAEAFEYARTKVTKSYEQEGLILTEHAALEDGNGGKLAATLFLASDRSRAAAIANVADPALRTLLADQRALEDRIAALKLQKDGMPSAQYDKQMEELLTQLALKTRAVRDAEAKK